MKAYKFIIKYFPYVLTVLFAANINGQTRQAAYTNAYNAVNSFNYSNNKTSLFNNYSPPNVNVSIGGTHSNYSVANPQNKEFGIDYDVSFEAYYDQFNILMNVTEAEGQSLIDYYDYKKHTKSNPVKSYDEWFAQQTTYEERKATDYLLNHVDYKDTRDYAPLTLRMGFKYNPPKALDKNQLMFNSVFGYLLLSNYKNFKISN